ncbi:CoA pyrophosphatase [Geobacter sp. AOG2]|uniref:NUDIX hydrolase n=1 Tax=Geobacter sp. AOG2 TaxID=1566347 RepID=UPI001CC71A18|nr:CoA pyrophosphatase [Geobacter sp. AOG2]GFE62320.1 coenzyme A pyrophosphatase [Geobacter sp. AOG2]
MDLPERARAALAARSRRAMEAGPVPAAVLLPLFLRNGDYHLLFTKRTGHLLHHSGEISFPGGALNPEEEPEQGALRETWEEVGIPPSQVEILGSLDDFYSIHHYLVTPLVGLIPDDYPYAVNPGEIERIIEAPVTHFLDPAVLRMEPRQWQGQSFMVRHYDFRGDDIWGLTAAILAQFLEIVFADELG